VTRSDLRIGDHEREAALTALSEHYAAGRITKQEYDERSGLVWQARTNAQLWPVFADLPGPHQSGRPLLRGVTAEPWGAPEPARPTRPRAPRFRLPFWPVLLVVIGVAMLTEGWVAFVLIGLLWWAGLLGRSRRACGAHGKPAG
jgi:hypothetical protein